MPKRSSSPSMMGADFRRGNEPICLGSDGEDDDIQILEIHLKNNNNSTPATPGNRRVQIGATSPSVSNESHSIGEMDEKISLEHGNAAGPSTKVTTGERYVKWPKWLMEPKITSREERNVKTVQRSADKGFVGFTRRDNSTVNLPVDNAGEEEMEIEIEQDNYEERKRNPSNSSSSPPAVVPDLGTSFPIPESNADTSTLPTENFNGQKGTFIISGFEFRGERYSRNEAQTQPMNAKLNLARSDPVHSSTNPSTPQEEEENWEVETPNVPIPPVQLDSENVSTLPVSPDRSTARGSESSLDSPFLQRDRQSNVRNRSRSRTPSRSRERGCSPRSKYRSRRPRSSSKSRPRSRSPRSRRPSREEYQKSRKRRESGGGEHHFERYDYNGNQHQNHHSHSSSGNYRGRERANHTYGQGSVYSSFKQGTGQRGRNNYERNSYVDEHDRRGDSSGRRYDSGFSSSSFSGANLEPLGQPTNVSRRRSQDGNNANNATNHKGPIAQYLENLTSPAPPPTPTLPTENICSSTEQLQPEVPSADPGGNRPPPSISPVAQAQERESTVEEEADQDPLPFPDVPGKITVEELELIFRQCPDKDCRGKKIFNTRKETKKHIRSVHKKERCNVCHKLFPLDSPQLHNHFNDLHAINERINCIICGDEHRFAGYYHHLILKHFKECKKEDEVDEEKPKPKKLTEHGFENSASGRMPSPSNSMHQVQNTSSASSPSSRPPAFQSEGTRRELLENAATSTRGVGVQVQVPSPSKRSAPVEDEDDEECNVSPQKKRRIAHVPKVHQRQTQTQPSIERPSPAAAQRRPSQSQSGPHSSGSRSVENRSSTGPMPRHANARGSIYIAEADAHQLLARRKQSQPLRRRNDLVLPPQRPTTSSKGNGGSRSASATNAFPNPAGPSRPKPATSRSVDTHRQQATATASVEQNMISGRSLGNYRIPKRNK